MNHALSTTIYAAVPVDPAITGVTATAPPGAQALLWGIAIILWLGFLAAMAGIARSGGHLAWAGIKPSHGGGNAASELAFGGVGLVITGAAGLIVTTIAALI